MNLYETLEELKKTDEISYNLFGDYYRSVESDYLDNQSEDIDDFIYNQMLDLGLIINDEDGFNINNLQNFIDNNLNRENTINKVKEKIEYYKKILDVIKY